MRQSRSSANELIKILQAVGQPLYLLDEQRKIVFVNEACANWLGISAEELTDRTANYQSSGDDALTTMANSLCPPPEAFQGRQVIDLISLPTGKPAHDPRRVVFLPLIERDGPSYSILALVDPSKLPDTDGASGDRAGEMKDEARRLHKLVRNFRQQMDRVHHLDRLAGQSAAMGRVRAQVKLAAATRETVLIFGPPGIGREHVARTIHATRTPAVGALIPISCSGLPPDALRSMLVSHLRRRDQADSPATTTLLLLNVELLPAEVQSELHQLLVDNPENAQIISTAAEPAEHWVAARGYHPKLAHRLSTLLIELPPLVDRPEDIPMIAQMLLEDINGQRERQLRGFTPETIDRLVQYDWPGQIDELAGMVREACLHAEGIEVIPTDLPKRLHQAAEAVRFARKPPEPIDLESFMAQVETELIRRALRMSKDNKSQAARLLGLNRPKLYRRMVHLGLELNDQSPTEE